MAQAEEPDRPSGRGAHSATGPTELPKHTWSSVLKRTVKEFKRDNLAASLTYYGVLAIFPAGLALMAILGLFGSSAIQPLVKNVSSAAPGAVSDILTTLLQQASNSGGKAGVALIIGVVIALWSASGYVAAFMRAANVVYDIGEGRPAWKTLPVRLGVTTAVIILLALTAFGVLVTGSIARTAGNAIGAGDTAMTAWNWAKWPVMVLLVSLAIALLYWAAPNVKRRFRWVSPGSLLAVLVWLLASVGFGFYVANFGSYSKTYGTFASIIVFLVWLWITNIAILFGLEFNAELERQRAIEGGHPPDEEPYAQPRDTRKLEE